MGIWADRVVPHLADRALAAEEMHAYRARVCAGLQGRVLELGFGSGHNVRHYPVGVTQVRAVEPSDVGWRLSERRRARATVPVLRSGLDGQALAEEDASCDAALTTFTLCTIPDAARALAEVRRALRPGGGLHLLEHGLAPDPGVARWQHRLDPVQQRMFAGCHLTRDMTALVEQAGFTVTSLEADYLPGPAVVKPWSYGYLLTAIRP